MRAALASSLVLVLAAACGGKSKGDAADPCADPCKDKKLAAMTCDGMGEHYAQAIADAPEIDEAGIETMRGFMVDQCNSMAWSQELIDCMAAATGPDDGEACVEMMSEEQRSSLADGMGVSDGDGAGAETEGDM